MGNGNLSGELLRLQLGLLLTPHGEREPEKRAAHEESQAVS